MKNLNYFIMSALFALTLNACTPKQPSVQAANPHEAFVKQFFQTFNAHDWQAFTKMYADTADFKDPSLGVGIVKQTREQTIKKYSELQQMFPNIKDEIVRIYPSDSTHVVVEFVSSGTAHDGSSFRLPICTILTIERGLITKDFTYFDNSGK
jgi:hypothetical protein